MNKQDLKSLLENIYYLLAESAPPIVPELPRDTVIPTVPPGTDAQSQTSFYDPYAQPPTLFPLGPWDGQWLPGFVALWPPPTSTLPPTGPGGMWVSYTNPGSTQVFYFYVYPGVDGMFPVWYWGEDLTGNFVFTELPPWGLPT